MPAADAAPPLGEIPAGSYSFEIGGRAVSFTLDEGWTSYGQQDGIFFELNVGKYEQAEFQGLSVFLTPLDAKAAVDHLRDLQGVKVLAETASSIGGLVGTQVSLSVGRRVADDGNWTGEEARVWFFNIGSADRNVTEYGLSVGHRADLAVLDLDGQTVVVSIEAPKASFTEFHSKAQPVVDTLQFPEAK